MLWNSQMSVPHTHTALSDVNTTLIGVDKRLLLCLLCLDNHIPEVITQVSQEIECQQIFFTAFSQEMQPESWFCLHGRDKKHSLIYSFWFYFSVMSSVTFSQTNLARAKERPAPRKTPSAQSTKKHWRWCFTHESLLFTLLCWLYDTPWLVTLRHACCK